MEDFKKVYTEKKDWPISTLKEMIEVGDIELQPEYQRDYIMDDKKASKLIESICLEIPLPSIYLCEEKDNHYSVIDGQQRIKSISRFCKNEFFLKGLEELEEFNKKYFKDLDRVLQRKILNTSIHSIIIKKESQELKYEIFSRLNQGSTKLKPQELRNCVYHGSFNDMLENLAESYNILKTMFIEENRRKKYQENILRFLALKNYRNIKSSLNKQLNFYMHEHQNDDEKMIEEFKKEFKRVIDIIKQVMGNDAFCQYDNENKKFLNKFAGSVYDSLMVAFSLFNKNDLIRNADRIRTNILSIRKENKIYMDSTSSSTGNKEKLIRRIEIIYESIKESIDKINYSENRIFDKKIKDELWEKDQKCSFCNQQILDYNDAEVDHIFPYSIGGETIKENAQLLHRSCNRQKSNKVDNN